ncbi:unnamed protein product, partial [Discosporangium mesarthrocarpum]
MLSPTQTQVPVSVEDGLGGWVTEAGLDTSQIITGSRRRSLKPTEVFTYDEMPRNYHRGPNQHKGKRDRTRIGSGGSAGSDKKREREARPKPRKGSTGRGGERALGVSSPTIEGPAVAHDPEVPLSQRGRAGDAGGGGGSKGLFPVRSSSERALSCSNGHEEGKGGVSCDGGGGAGCGAGGGACGLGGGSREACEMTHPTPPGQVQEGREDKKKGDKRRKALKRKRRPSSGPGASPRSWWSGDGGESEADLEPPTYIAHAQVDSEEVEEEAPEGSAGSFGHTAVFPSQGGCGVKRRPRLWRRGSALAMVFSELCRACQAAGVDGGGEPGRGGYRGCYGAGDTEGEGGGPVKPGEYVFLRCAGAEGVQRALMAEGEWALPQPGGALGPALTGQRIRVWRHDAERGVVGGKSRGGSFEEADIVGFQERTGMHRMRYVIDGLVTDERLRGHRELAEAGCTPQGSGEGRGGLGETSGSRGGWLPWQQRRIRQRTRDGIRTNTAALSVGPGGEVRGLLGDMGDSPYEREENWRWATSRWRWGLGERDGYVPGDEEGGGEGRSGGRGRGGDGNGDGHHRSAGITWRGVSWWQQCSRGKGCGGVVDAGDGMFPPIGRVLAVEKRSRLKLETNEGGGGGRCKDTEMEVETETGTETETFLKVARMWYPQDTFHGMDPFIHGKAEVFEACRAKTPLATNSSGSPVEGAPLPPLGTGLGTGTSRPKRHVKTEPGLAEPGPTTDAVALAAPHLPPPPALPLPMGRLEEGRPVPQSLELEPVVSWVRACRARRLARVHPCADARLNPCAGKVVNDPHHPQAEFFVSHRYCPELDAYFPTQDVGSGSGDLSGAAAGSSFGSFGLKWGLAKGVTGLGAGAGAGAGAGFGVGLATVKLLKRHASESGRVLPPKLHPLKKRMSLGRATSLETMATAATLTARSAGEVVGAGNCATLNGCARGTGGGGDGSALGRKAEPQGGTRARGGPECRGARAAAATECYLCHRCRHVLPAHLLVPCQGECCNLRFCVPCKAGRGSGSGAGGRGRRGTGRAGGGMPSVSGGVKGGGDDVGREGFKEPWLGPCCRGGCGCRECAVAAGEGLIAGWRACNGLPHMIPKDGGLQGGSSFLLPSPSRPGQKHPRSAEKGPGGRGEPRLRGVGGRDNDPAADGGGKEGLKGTTPSSAKEDDRGVKGPGFVGGDREGEGTSGSLRRVNVRWCVSCGMPGGGRRALTLCFYCRTPVHSAGCRAFEDRLILRRLGEWGVAPGSGLLSGAPTGEGAVGHGLALCVHGRWRAGVVLSFNAASGAHFVRYVDSKLGEKSGGGGLDSIPWEGEWVVLPKIGVCGAVSEKGEAEGRTGAAVAGSAASPVTAVRWALAEVVQKLYPDTIGSAGVPGPKTGPNSTDVAGAAGREARKALRPLKRLLKRWWEERQRDTAAAGGREVPVTYRPPVVALPRRYPPLGMGVVKAGGGGGGGARGGVGGGSGCGGGNKGKEDTPLWVCRKCIEGKLRRLQRVVRSQF